ncbi:MAG: PepSY domain-containing protein [Rhodospirillales bacterium]|nr:PepSY domain-containing protein [Rhodospirillales bacterium]
MGGFLGACRTLHGWLGVFIMPWVVIIGATGFYLNHAGMFNSLLAQDHFSETQLEKIKPSSPVTRESAQLLGASLWPDAPIKSISRKLYHGRPSYFVHKARGNIILSIPTGHYYLKTRYTRRTYGPGGDLLHTKYYWRRVFRSLHEAGWVGRGLGTWLADAVAIAMMVFGVTGVFMWSAPKIHRWRRRSKALPDNR